jgi:hypothetical protein
MSDPRRGGTRVSCEIAASLRVPGCPLPEECLVILVNPQGCAARFNRPVELGTTVRLEGLPAGCARARIVNCISVEKDSDLWLLGLALERPGNVWGVQQPPQDWEEPLTVAMSVRPAATAAAL